MLAYFRQDKPKRKGRQKTSIVTTLRRDLKRLPNSVAFQLKSISDLEELRRTAENRIEWKYITKAIYEAAQVEQSDDYSTDGP